MRLHLGQIEFEWLAGYLEVGQVLCKHKTGAHGERLRFEFGSHLHKCD